MWQQLELFPTSVSDYLKETFGLDPFRFTIKNKFIFKTDNGYMLDFHYESSDCKIKTKRVFSTEGELETAVQELELEWDNLLREKHKSSSY